MLQNPLHWRFLSNYLSVRDGLGLIDPASKQDIKLNDLLRSLSDLFFLGVYNSVHSSGDRL